MSEVIDVAIFSETRHSVVARELWDGLLEKAACGMGGRGGSRIWHEVAEG